MMNSDKERPTVGKLEFGPVVPFTPEPPPMTVGVEGPDHSAKAHVCRIPPELREAVERLCDVAESRGIGSEEVAVRRLLREMPL
jgi:hypothetical protein